MHLHIEEYTKALRNFYDPLGTCLSFLISATAPSLGVWQIKIERKKHKKTKNLLVLVIKCLTGRQIPVEQALTEAACGQELSLPKGQREASVKGHDGCRLKCILDHTIDNWLTIK